MNSILRFDIYIRSILKNSNVVLDSMGSIICGVSSLSFLHEKSVRTIRWSKTRFFIMTFVLECEAVAYFEINI